MEDKLTPVPKLILTTEARPAELSAAPSGFGNASPFQCGSMSRDPVRLAALGIAAIAAVTFLASMIAILFMHAP